MSGDQWLDGDWQRKSEETPRKTCCTVSSSRPPSTEQRGPIAIRAKDLSDQDILHGTSQQFSAYFKYQNERW